MLVLVLGAAMLLLLLSRGGSQPHGPPAIYTAAGRLAGRHVAPQASPAPPGAMVQALSSCTDFRCLRAAHALPRGSDVRFNFPHFFIIGGCS